MVELLSIVPRDSLHETWDAVLLRCITHVTANEPMIRDAHLKRVNLVL